MDSMENDADFSALSKKEKLVDSKALPSQTFKWSPDLMNNIEILRGQHFEYLLANNFKFDLDYIAALVEDERGELTVLDGCEWARQSLDKEASPGISKMAKNTHYYYIANEDKKNLNYLCSQEHLNEDGLQYSFRYLLYIFANDSTLPIEDRVKYQFELANYYFHAKDEENHLLKAFRWYDKVAASGHAQALFAVGYFYESGEGNVVAKNLEAARSWYKEASVRTDDVTILLYTAQRFEQVNDAADVNFAANLYQRAASSGDLLGMASLIDFYERMNREEDRPFIQELREKLPYEYQSKTTQELIQELTKQGDAS